MTGPSARGGTLYLIPVPIGAGSPAEVLPAATLRILNRLDLFFAESPKSARAMYGAAVPDRPVQSIEFHAFSGDTPPGELARLLDRMAGRDAGVISEAGAPGVADPGARLVRLARQRGIAVVACTGPSAILLALMGSGLEGQRFSFHGYLPIDAVQLRDALRRIDRTSAQDRATQIFIETPYRNDRMLDAVLAVCRDDTVLSVAAGLDTADVFTRTAPIVDWRATPRAIGKRPAVFMLLAAPEQVPSGRGRGGKGARPGPRQGSRKGPG